MLAPVNDQVDITKLVIKKTTTCI